MFAPDGATQVRAVRGNSVVDTSDVVDHGALVDAADAPDLVFEAVDATGRLLAQGRQPVTMSITPEVVGW